MSRALKGRDAPQFGPVADYQLAPHRYVWHSPYDPDTPEPISYGDVKRAAPYKVGEVVLVVHGSSYRKAIIAVVFCTKDSCDFWREAYRVLPETKKGAWSKIWHVAHPGFIQRGYQRAGLAPDVDAAEREEKIAELRARREARGLSDPVKVLRAVVGKTLAEGATPIEEV